MTDKYTLDNIISDAGFYEITKNNIQKWNGDVNNPEFIATWSAIDYRIKFNNTLKNKKAISDELFKLISSREFYPQPEVCGPPTIRIDNISMSPRGDLCASVNYDPRTIDQKTAKRDYVLTVFFTGEMRPLTMIPLGYTINPEYLFSNDSRYIAVIMTEKVEVWDLFTLSLRYECNVNRAFSKQSSWSSNNRFLFITDDDGPTLIDCDKKEKFELSIDFPIYTTAMNETGSILYIVSENKIMIYDTEQDCPLKTIDIEFEYVHSALSFFHKGSFYTILSGRIVRIDDNYQMTVKDLSNEIETSEKWKIFSEIESEREHNYHNRNINTDGNTVKYCFGTGAGYTKCTVDMNDLSYSITDCDFHYKNKPMDEYRYLDEKIIRKIVSDNRLLDHKEYAKDGRTFYVPYLDRIIAFHYLKKVELLNVYLYKEFIVKNKDCSFYDNHQFIDPKIMEPFDNGFSDTTDGLEENDQWSSLLEGNNNILYKECEPCDIELIAPPITKNSAIVHKLGYNSWVQFKQNGRSYHISSDMYDDLATIVSDNGEYFDIKMPDGRNYEKRLPFIITNDAIYRINTKTKDLELILSDENHKDVFDSNRKLEPIFNDKITLFVKSEQHGDSLYLLSNGKLKLIASDVNKGTMSNVLCCVCDDKIVYAKDDELFILNEDGETIKTVKNLTNHDKWAIIGVNSTGVISLSKISIECENHFNKTFDVDLARISAQDLNLDIFQNKHLHVENINNFGIKFDMKGNKIVHLEHNDNPFRDVRICYSVIKQDMIHLGNTLIPDNSRLSCIIKQIPNDRYVVISNGITTDELLTKELNSNNRDEEKEFIEKNREQSEQKAAAQRIRIRPIIRVMDIKSGKMIKLNQNKNTEGQIYGPKGLMASQLSPAIYLDDKIIIGFENNAKWESAVMSWDVSSGKQYPSNKEYIPGVIIGYDHNVVIVGSLNNDRLINKLSYYDSKLSLIGEKPLNVYLCRIKNGLSYHDKTKLVNYDRPYESICFLSKDNSVYTDPNPKDDLPFIIIRKISDCDELASEIKPVSFDDIKSSIKWKRVEITLCTLRYGIVCNETDTEIVIPVHDDYCVRNIIINEIELRYFNSRYYLFQLYGDKNVSNKFYRYKMSVIENNSVIDEIDNISVKSGYMHHSVTQSELGISFVRFEDGINVHYLYDGKPIKKTAIDHDGGYLTSAYCDENLSVTSDSKNVVITNGDKTSSFLINDFIPDDHWYDDSGDLHIVYSEWGEIKELIINKSLNDIRFCNFVKKDNNVYIDDSYIIKPCHGLFGAYKQ